MQESNPGSSSRILYHVPCVVCRDHSSGKHYGVFACDGCAGFFKRSVRRDRRYACKARNAGQCLVDKAHRNQCRACRFDKCIDVGMNKDAVQHERGPRHSTIRRQMDFFFKDAIMSSSDIPISKPSILDLTVQKDNLVPPPLQIGLNENPFNSYNRPNLLSSPPGPSTQSPLPFPYSLQNSTHSVTICEAAASLLFMNFKWAKNVPGFTSLSISDRLLLLEESWLDLFVISSAQFLFPLDLNVLLNDKISRINITEVVEFQLALTQLATVQPDSNEFSCLRAIVLFKTSFSDKNNPGSSAQSGAALKRLQDLPAVAALQDHSQSVLNEYTTRMYPLEPTRVSQLLQVLPAVRSVSSTTIVEMFFRATIGDISIERIINDMYRTGKDIA